MLHTRRAEVRDLESLRDIYYKVRKEEFFWETQIKREDFDISTDGEAVYVAEEDGEIVGFVSIWEPDCFVHNLFIRRSARRRGVGLALLEYARDQYSSAVLTLKCVQNNKNAYRFYLKHGWTVLDTVDDEVIPYYLMQWK